MLVLVCAVLGRGVLAADAVGDAAVLGLYVVIVCISIFVCVFVSVRLYVCFCECASLCVFL